MISKEEAKGKIKELIKEFSEYSKEKLDSMPEEDIKFQFIEPLLEYLGWERKDITKETRVLKGRADYILKLGNQEVLVVEAKKTNVRLSEEEGRQAVSYAYHRKIKFAILTNFKQIRVYHALSNIKNIDNNLLKKEGSYFRLEFNEFLDNFDLLWLLSKESFEKQEINKLLSKKDEKILKPVDVKILEDLLQIREWLTKELKSKKNYLEKEQIDEIVQILIDRLIFIRSIEDRKIEAENFLLGMSKQVRNQEVHLQFFPYLLQKFEYFNKKYDSKLFELGILEKEGTFSDDILHKVVKVLYFGLENNQTKYMFDEIPGDLFGSIYEQYLGVITQSTEKRVKLEKESGKRKKMGIYYTPSYIVDYIVKNTIGEYIKDKNIDEILKVKILDPACGSGSFLIRAFQEVCDNVEEKLKNKQFGKAPFTNYYERLSLAQKVAILINCIHGVDLDEKAVELTRLNLLLNLLDGESKDTKTLLLPHLENNIKCGNSLIDDPKVSKNALKWQVEFKDIINSGGFDVVIGNPPYVKSRGLEGNKDRIFIEKNFETPYKMWDLYIPFIEKGMKVLKIGGQFSMIIPDTIGIADYTKKLVEFLINRYSIYQIDFFPEIEVFAGVGVRSKIIFVKNSKDIKKCKQIIHENKIDNSIEFGTVNNDDANIFKISKFKINFNLDKTIPLGKVYYVSYGARFNSDKDDPKKFKKEDLIFKDKDKIHTHLYTEGKYLGRYHINKELFVEWGTDRCPKRLVRPTFPQLYPPQKILMSRQKGVSTISDDGQICDNTIIVGVPYLSLKGVENKSINKYLKNINLNRKEGEENSKNFDIKYILGILNSKLISYFLKTKMRGNIDIYPDDWKDVPVKIASEKQQQKIILLVNQMLELQKKYHDPKVIGNEKERLKKQIDATDYEIDQEIYKLYGLSEDEIKIVEESVK